MNAAGKLRRVLALGAGVALTCALAWPQSPQMHPVQPLPPTEQLRERMRQLQDEREQNRLVAEAAQVKLTSSLTAPPERPHGQWSFVEIKNDLDRMTAIVSFVPQEEAQKGAVRFVACCRGAQWLKLPEGTWRMEIVLLEAEGKEPYVIQPQQVELARQNLYALELNRQLEGELRRARRWEERKPQPPESGSKNKPAGKPQDPAGREPASPKASPTPSVEWILPSSSTPR